MRTIGREQVIRYLGRRSGLPRTLRVRCVTVGGELLIRVSRPESRRWWRNFLSPWPITVADRQQLVHGSGEVVDSQTDEGKRLAAAYFERFPVPARYATSYDPGKLIFLRCRPRPSG